MPKSFWTINAQNDPGFSSAIARRIRRVGAFTQARAFPQPFAKHVHDILPLHLRERVLLQRLPWHLTPFYKLRERGIEAAQSASRAAGPRLDSWLQQKRIRRSFPTEDKQMLWTIFLILLVLWALGLVTSYTMGGMIHLLLVIALVVVVIQLLQGRRVV
jgi:hypothetical protein